MGIIRTGDTAGLKGIIDEKALVCVCVVVQIVGEVS
jgi:hypothetical protein